jgi:hypothetical protein
MTEEDYKYRKSYTLIPTIFFLLLGVWLIYDSSKTIESVEKLTGIVTDKNVVKERYKGNNYRYTFAFKTDQTDQSLGIFLGSGEKAIEKGNEYYSLFQIGQPINVYYDNNLLTEAEGITRFIYKIEYQGETILVINQSPRKIIGFVSLAVGIVFILLRIWLTRKYERELNEKELLPTKPIRNAG